MCEKISWETCPGSPTVVLPPFPVACLLLAMSILDPSNCDVIQQRCRTFCRIMTRPVYNEHNDFAFKCWETRVFEDIKDSKSNLTACYPPTSDYVGLHNLFCLHHRTSATNGVNITIRSWTKYETSSISASLILSRYSVLQRLTVCLTNISSTGCNFLDRIICGNAPIKILWHYINGVLEYSSTQSRAIQVISA